MVILSLLGIVSAHQPVMDMAPRWEGGYGFQTRIESFSSSTLKQGNRKTKNPLGLTNEKTIVWLEGIYSKSPRDR